MQDAPEEVAAKTAGKVQEAHNDLVLSFLALRKAIGILGLFLPAGLLVFAAFQPAGLLPSISHYYYSPMSDLFVGTMVAIGVFLWAYEGYRPEGDELITDKRVGRAAALGAFGVAFSPIPPETDVVCTVLQCALGNRVAALVHYGAAVLFFAALAVFCLVLFVKSAGGQSSPKRRRNGIFRVCGWTIVAALAVIVALGLLPGPEMKARINGLSLVFWSEAVAVVAFAFSWIVKGRMIAPLNG